MGEAIEFEGADTVAAVFVEPVQNAGGCFPPPPGYFERLREICDELDVLLVSDETICAFGRIGELFACKDFDYVPDIITCAKGLTSGYSPLGAVIASERIFEPFRAPARCSRTATRSVATPSRRPSRWRTSTSSSARVSSSTSTRTPRCSAALERLLDLPIVGDVRGEGFFYGIELVKDQATRATFDDAESERLLRGFLSPALWEAGLYCRADDRGDPVIQLAPAARHRPPEFDDIEQRLRSVLTEAGRLL